MAKIRTIIDLQDRIDEERSWRKIELTRLKLLHKSSKDVTEKQCLRRWFSVAAYGHYEGFYKAASEALFQYISTRGIRYTDLQQNYLAACIKGVVNETAGSKRLHTYGQIVDFFISNLSLKAKIPLSNIIDTGDNLSSRILNDLFYTIGIEFPPEVEVKTRKIDDLILGSRNKIAHGNRHFISEDDLESINEIVLFLIEKYSELIIQAAASEAYKRPGRRGQTA